MSAWWFFSRSEALVFEVWDGEAGDVQEIDAALKYWQDTKLRGYTDHYTAIIYASYDGSTCAGGLGKRDASGVQRSIAVVV